MKRVFAFLLFGAICAHAEMLHFGNFSVQWADGWTRGDGDRAIRIVAPRPALAVVTIDLVDQESPLEQPYAYAKQALPQIAARHGEVIEPLASEALPSGGTLFSIVCYDKQRDHFGILFVVVSPKGRIAQLAAEGRGHPKTVISDYRRWVRTAHWDNEANPPVGRRG